MDYVSSLISAIFWVFIILSLLMPYLRQKALENSRVQLIQQIEKKRKSRVIAMIHRQETMSILGIPVARYISIEDSEAVLRAIRLTPDEMPLDIILHTPGGLVLATEQIAHALIQHKGDVTVFIPHYAMSGGTLLTLAADKIVMDENAVLGPVDPQIGNYPAASIIKVTESKDINKTDDETLILADVSKKAVNQVRNFVKTLLLSNRYDDVKAENLSTALTEGKWTHDYPITFEEAKELGLNVSCEMPKEIYELMDLYPQSPGMRPSVQFIPLPYKTPAMPAKPGSKEKQ